MRDAASEAWFSYRERTQQLERRVVHERQAEWCRWTDPEWRLLRTLAEVAWELAPEGMYSNAVAKALWDVQVLHSGRQLSKQERRNRELDGLLERLGL